MDAQNVLQEETNNEIDYKKTCLTVGIMTFSITRLVVGNI